MKNLLITTLFLSLSFAVTSCGDITSLDERSSTPNQSTEQDPLNLMSGGGDDNKSGDDKSASDICTEKRNACEKKCNDQYLQDILACGDSYANCMDSILIPYPILGDQQRRICEARLSICKSEASSRKSRCSVACSKQAIACYEGVKAALESVTR